MLRSKKFGTYKVVKWVMFAVFVLYAISLLVPFLWMFINMFKTTGEYSSGNYFGFPNEFTFQNLGDVLQMEIDGQSIASMFLVSVVITVVGTFLNVGLSAISAYIVAKYRFPGRKVILAVAIFSMILPIVGTLPAQTKMMDDLMLNDTIIGVLFLYSGCFGFNFIMLHSSFEGISWSYAEAAQIDGANRWQILFHVMLPMAKGPIIAVSILQAIAIWSDYATPKLFLPQGLTTLAVGLQELQAQNSASDPLVFSAVMLAVIPILILFICFQKTIIKNTVAGGLKG